MDYDAFVAAYRAIIAKAVAKLRPDSFCAFVVGEVREKRSGFYRGFVVDTIRAFEDAGARLYNEAILVTSAGSLPIRATRVFNAAKKLGKTHQNVLVFVKGDPKAASRRSTRLPIRPVPITPIVTSGIRLPICLVHSPRCIWRFAIWVCRSKVSMRPRVSSATAGAGASGV